MTEEPSPEVKKEKKSRIEIFEEPGSSRAVASASWTIFTAIIGAIMLFVYQIYVGFVYGEGGLSYITVTGSIFALTVAISTGSGGAFIKLAKESYTIDEEKGKYRAVQMAKTNLIIGLMANIALFILAFIVISDPLLFIMMIGAASAIFLSFMRDIFTNMFSIMNRFDMASIVGGLYGVIYCVYGLIVILLGLPPQALVFGILFMTLIMLGLSIYFYNRIKHKAGLGLKDLFLPSKQYPLKKEFAKTYLSYGVLTTLSNLVVFGIFTHIVLLMAFLCYNWAGAALGLSGDITVIKMTDLLSIIDSFVFIEVAIIMFSGPLNVEIAEAYIKKDQQSIESSINAIGKVGLMLAMPISVAMVVFAVPFLRYLGTGYVSTTGSINEALLFQGWITFAITAFGQAFYGLAVLFGAALIGSGEAKKSAIGFGAGALMLFIITPLMIFLFGFIDDLFPAFGLHSYSLIGTGVAFLISGIFVLPYLARATRQHLKIKYDLRIKRLIICMTVLGLFLVFAALVIVEPFAIFLQSFLPLSLEILQIISLLTFILIGFILCIICYCFFGVAGKGDGKLLQDAFDSFNLGWLARFMRKIGRFFYELNPLNPKLDRKNSQ